MATFARTSLLALLALALFAAPLCAAENNRKLLQLVSVSNVGNNDLSCNNILNQDQVLNGVNVLAIPVNVALSLLGWGSSPSAGDAIFVNKGDYNPKCANDYQNSNSGAQCTTIPINVGLEPGYLTGCKASNNNRKLLQLISVSNVGNNDLSCNNILNQDQILNGVNVLAVPVNVALSLLGWGSPSAGDAIFVNKGQYNPKCVNDYHNSNSGAQCTTIPINVGSEPGYLTGCKASNNNRKLLQLVSVSNVGNNDLSCNNILNQDQILNNVNVLAVPVDVALSLLGWGSPSAGDAIFVSKGQYNPQCANKYQNSNSGAQCTTIPINVGSEPGYLTGCKANKNN